MNKIVFFTLATFFLFALPLLAKDKVVVVPLGKSVATSASSDSWIRIYDGNDNFVGFTLDLELLNGGGILSNKGYYTRCIGCDILNPVYFLTNDCTGKLYSDDVQDGMTSSGYQNIIRGNGKLWLFEGDGNTYYSKHDTHLTLTAGTPFSVWQRDPPPPDYVNCSSFPSGTAVDVELYELFLNDPAVTGFLDIADYTRPYKMIYNLPATP